MRQSPLTMDEATLFHVFKLAGEVVMAGITKDITAATGLSGPDFGVLSRLQDLGHGELRQNDLAASMRWDKSRLSHQLTRMEARKLLRRRPMEGKGVMVVLAAGGRKALLDARPAHAAAIRKHLLTPLDAEQRKALHTVATLLLGDDAGLEPEG